MAIVEERNALGLLRTCKVFSACADETLLELSANARVALFNPRQVIYLPGDRSEGVHFLADGRVKVSKVTRDGKELTLDYRAAGGFFGEGCLIDGSPRQEMAESMAESTTVEISRSHLAQFLDTTPGAAYPFARALIERQSQLEAKMEQLIFKDVGSKLAELLLSLGHEHGIQNELGVILGVKITHQEMANLIGSTRETVSLTLSQFKRKGFIATQGRRVILANQDGLRTLA